MNSLFLSRFRPGTTNGGAALRNGQSIRSLARLGPVDVLSLGDDGRVEPTEGVREAVHFPLRALHERRGSIERLRTRLWRLRPGVHPSVEIYRHAEVDRWLSARLHTHTYDCAVISEIGLAGYLPVLRRGRCRVVFDCHNVESVLASDVGAASNGAGRWWYRHSMRLLERRMFAVESRTARGADVVWACSERDAEALRRLFRLHAAVTVVPNGVDVPAYRAPAAIPDAVWTRTPVTLVYPGTFSYFPNEDAALRLVREVLPAIRARGRDCRVVLVGRDPTEAMREAAAADPGVEVTGPVDTILPFFHRPAVVALPIQIGSGTRLKILEAFAAGSPVVSTTKGAEGIEATQGCELLLCESSAEMGDAVIRLWDDHALRHRLCAGALDLVVKRYSWEAAAGRITSSLGVRA